MNRLDKRLVLFLSRATPLRRWAKIGILSREIALYQRLGDHLKGVSIVSSGAKEELTFQNELGDVEILYNRWNLPPNVYSLLAPFLHRQALKRADIYKSNQLDGAWTAVMASRIHGKPVVVRGGYLWSTHLKESGGGRLKTALAKRLEKFSLRHATAVMLTTAEMKEAICGQYRLPEKAVWVVPNYVDTRVFHPAPQVEKVSGRICFVGRLHPRKNIDLVIRALEGIPQASLLLIGDGPHRTALESLAGQHGVESVFLGAIPQKEIPAHLNGSEIFVLPSKFEGHPKALIEAMSCGLAVLGTDVEGIRGLICHGENGWLCRPAVDDIRSGLQHLLEDGTLRARLGSAAREFADREFSLDRIVELEYNLIEQLVGPV
jgi:glycosyltransferase involved in cell wall biosynthesis